MSHKNQQPAPRVQSKYLEGLGAGGARAGRRTASRGPKSPVPDPDQWEVWVDYAAARKRVADIAKLAGYPGTHPLKWAVPDSYQALPVPRLLKQLTRLGKRHRWSVAATLRLLESWLAPAQQDRLDAVRALEAIAWCQLLPQLATVVSADRWRTLFDTLQDRVTAAADICLDDDPVGHQLWNGELPLTMAWVFPELPSCRRLVRPAGRALSRGLVELLDGEGLLHARHFAHLQTLLACWTRCALIGQATGWPCWDVQAGEQYEWMVEQALRATRPDGTVILSRGTSGDWCPDLWNTLLALRKDRALRALTKLALPGRSAWKPPTCSRKQPASSVYSEWSELCLMRANWSRNSPQFACQFDGDRLRAELVGGGRTLWSGDVTPAVTIDGEPLEIQSAWTELCWFTDKDVDYLELEADGSHGWQVQRQMLLVRRDHVFLLADVILGPRPAAVRYEVRFPLADDIRFDPAGETREGCLRNNRPLCTVLPLPLPEWRAAAAPGTLQAAGNQLQWVLEERTPRLYAPLWFDVAPSRVPDRRTWRSLTVADQLQIQPRDVAVGYRVQTGRAQWLVYRSLAPRCSRSVLGQNLSAEFVAARFEPDGTLDELIEIES